MLGISSSKVDENLPPNSNIESKVSNNIDYPKSLSNYSFSKNLHKKDISDANLNASTVPMNSQKETNNTAFRQNNINTNQTQKKKEGVFSRMFNYIKNNWNPWKIEEEEYIDAHGFKAKRPKTKIPLRKAGDDYNSDIQKAGGESMAYATQHSGFGNLFL